mmetsp:Transcript_23619/g.75639  ORF Transcript_23619/g.75639 Transcript_23619/m.75639 type:complete len:262 (-) Transcript_23619:1650-2435(-)
MSRSAAATAAWAGGSCSPANRLGCRRWGRASPCWNARWVRGRAWCARATPEFEFGARAWVRRPCVTWPWGTMRERGVGEAAGSREEYTARGGAGLWPPAQHLHAVRQEGVTAYQGCRGVGVRPRGGVCVAAMGLVFFFWARVCASWCVVVARRRRRGRDGAHDRVDRPLGEELREGGVVAGAPRADARNLKLAREGPLHRGLHLPGVERDALDVSRATLFLAQDPGGQAQEGDAGGGSAAHDAPEALREGGGARRRRQRRR